MHETKTISDSKYLEALSYTLHSTVDLNHYNLNGYKEEAICLEKEKENWIVYLAMRNQKIDTERVDSVLEACISLIHRVCAEKEAKAELIHSFLRKLTAT